MNISLLGRLYQTVPKLEPLLPLLENGELGVVRGELPKGAQAAYAATAGSVSTAPEVEDAIVFPQDSVWTGSLFQRSLAVHEGYHALDDYEAQSPTEIPLLETEATAWKGQAAYVVSELSKAETPAKELAAFLTEANAAAGQMGVMALAVAAAAAEVPAELEDSRCQLIEGLKGEVGTVTGVDELLANPHEKLPDALNLLYWCGPEFAVVVDGIT